VKEAKIKDLKINGSLSMKKERKCTKGPRQKKFKQKDEVVKIGLSRFEFRRV
jgi:hypothetical protein